MLGGVTVNFLLAIFIYIGTTFYYGDIILPNSNIKDGLFIESTVAQKAGILTGDKIIAVDGTTIENFFRNYRKRCYLERILLLKEMEGSL